MEELRHRRVIDAADRCLIAVAADKYSHQLEHQRPHLYNPVTGLIATSDENVADFMVLGEMVESKYIASLPSDNSISSPINTMSILKTQPKIPR